MNAWTPSQPWCFRHPFHDYRDGDLDDDDELVADFALTLAEQRMIRLSYALRSKPSWWTKYKIPEIRAKWKVEAMNQEVIGGKSTEAEVEYVLDELQAYEKMRDEATGIESSCHTRIWQSDLLISADLQKNLIPCISVLEAVPENQKDWHPRSNNQVLDLVHPSLYCLVYGRTLAYPPVDEYPKETRSSEHLQVVEGPQEYIHFQNQYTPFFQDPAAFSLSEKFAWIPTDFSISKDGTTARPLAYINNLHPSHTGLYSALSQVVARFSHLFDRVLTDLHPGNPNLRRIDGTYDYPAGDNERPSKMEGETWAQFDERYVKWEDSRPITMPTVPNGGYQTHAGKLENRDIKYSIQGRECQVIIKLANIHLTPEKPTYAGGSWHVEGMSNERIVASGIYYYSSENITESHLSFRTRTSFSYDWYHQSDASGVRKTFGLERDGACNQELGSISTSEGRCIAFPNVYQHRVSPFELIDKTKPGHRKIIALFLVDPTFGQEYSPDPLESNDDLPNQLKNLPIQPKIPSTSIIPPQQADWIRKALKADNIPPSNPIHKLPVELVDMVITELQTHHQTEEAAQEDEDAIELGAIMTIEEANKYRLELMDERTAFVQDHDDGYFVHQFNMCEH